MLSRSGNGCLAMESEEPVTFRDFAHWLHDAPRVAKVRLAFLGIVFLSGTFVFAMMGTADMGLHGGRALAAGTGYAIIYVLLVLITLSIPVVRRWVTGESDSA